MAGIGVPSIRLKALRLPPSSRIATFSLTPISLAFATASSTIFWASSEEMLCFFTTSAIGHLPPLDRASVSPREHPSVDRQRCTDNVRCLVRANEHDGICNLFGRSHALGRNV